MGTRIRLAEKGNLFWFLSGILTCIYCQVLALIYAFLVITYSCTVLNWFFFWFFFFLFVYGTLKLYCCCSERHRHTGYCYYASGVLKISSCVPHDGHLLVNLVKKLNRSDRQRTQAWDRRTCEQFLYASSDCFNGGKTPGRLVWSFCNANISSWSSTGLHLLLLQRYNHVLQSVLNDFDLCDVFYKVISDTETVDCPCNSWLTRLSMQ